MKKTIKKLSVLILAIASIMFFMSCPSGQEEPTPASNKVVDILAIAGVTAPVTDAAPVTSITANDQYTGAVSWSPKDDVFKAETAYTATITLVVKAGYTFEGLAANSFTVAGASATNEAGSGKVTAVFPKTTPKPITSATIEGISPSAEATMASETPDNVEYSGSITWYEGETESKDTEFLTGKTYSATITLTAKTGWIFKEDTTFTVSNATSAEFTIDSTDSKKGTLVVNFPLTKDSISATIISGLDTPAVGATPASSVSFSTSNEISSSSLSWDPDPLGEFKGEVAYTATITLELADGYTFNNVKVDDFTIENVLVEISKDFSESEGTLKVNFPATAPAVVSEKTISGLTAPVATETPVAADALSGGGDEWVVSTLEWSDTPSTFAYYTVYTATVTLTAKTGFTFTGFTGNFTVTGETVSTSDNNGTSIKLTVTFPETAAAPITAGEIAGLTAPVVNEARDTSVTNGTQWTTVDDVVWKKADGSSFTGNFFGETSYKAEITLTAIEGFTFTGFTGSFSVTGATDVSTRDNNGTSIKLTVTFPATAAAPITAGAIDGLTAPVVNEARDTSVTNGTHWTVDGVVWKKADGSNFTGNFFGETSYKAEITLTANTGYTFAGVSADSFTVAGATVTHPAGSDTTLTVTAVFPATAPEPITAGAIDGLTAPVAAATPVAADALSGSSKWRVTELTWSDSPITTFAYYTVYTATVTLTANTGYTFNGLAANSFTVDGAPVGTNVKHSAGSGTALEVTVEFPITAPEPITAGAIAGLTAPVVNVAPDTSVADGTQWTAGTVDWKKADGSFFTGNFFGETSYKAEITLTANTGYTFTGFTGSFSVTGATDVSTIDNNGTSIKLTVTFPETDPAVVTNKTISGLTVPVVLESPVSIITANTQYDGSVVWNPPVSGTFASGTEYTATITLTAKHGFTFDGLTGTGFTVAGASNSPTLSFVDGNPTLVVDFLKTEQLLVYDGNGNDYGTTTLPDKVAFSLETEFTVEERAFQDNGLLKNGYNFVCWNTKANGSGVDYNAGDSLTTSVDVTLYAKWKASTTGFSYNVDAITGYSGTATSVVIPEHNNGKLISLLGGAAFKDNATVTAVEIPESIETIDSMTFDHCSNLTEVNIPNSVTKIGVSAFANCISLSEIYIPDSVEDLGSTAFATCTNLSVVNIPPGISVLKQRTFSDCVNLTEIDIPDNITVIENDVFYNCGSLTSVTIGNGVTSIWEEAFYSCKALTNVNIGTAVTSIGEEAFYRCEALTNVNIPDSVTSIGVRAFGNCEALTSVTIGTGVTSIEKEAFSFCKALTDVTIPDSVTSMGSSVFIGCAALTSATIGNGVTSIGENSFKECKLLTSVTIGNSVTSIGNYAFYKCAALTDITIPNSVNSIGDYAFRSSSALNSVTIGNGVTSIGDYAFYYCFSLSSVYVNRSFTTHGTLTSLEGSSVFDYNASGRTIYVPSDSVSDYQVATNWSKYSANIVSQ